MARKKRCAEIHFNVHMCGALYLLAKGQYSPENSCVLVGGVWVMRAAAMGAAHVTAPLTINYGCYVYINGALHFQGPAASPPAVVSGIPCLLTVLYDI